MVDLYNKSLKKENQILKIGLLRFSDSVETVYDLTAMTSAEFTRLKEIASNSSTFEPTGSTAIGRTLEVGTEKLMQSGTIFKSLIVISDGVNTSGVDPEKVMEAIVNNRNNKSTPDLVISTISVLVSFIGFDISANYFSSLEQLGARVTSASNKEELIQSLKNIFIADITKLEAK
jgi:hypothetical protein